MSIRPRIAAAVLAVLLLLLPASGASAATTAEVTRLTATAGATALSVSGQATYASDETVVVVDDPVGDTDFYPVRVPVPATDIDSASIAATTPEDLEFAVTLADPDGDTTVPVFLVYQWRFEVSTRIVTLTAGTSNERDTADGVMRFTWLNCHASGGDCSSGTLDGEYADGVLTWSVPTSVVGVAGGSKLNYFEGGSGIFVASHVPSYGTSRQRAYDSAVPASYVVPKATVQLGVAPAGTATDDVVLNRVVTAASDGSFTASLPLAGGGGVVAARACFGAVCGARASATY